MTLQAQTYNQQFTTNGVGTHPIDVYADIPGSGPQIVVATFSSSQNDTTVHIKLPCKTKSIMCNTVWEGMSRGHWKLGKQYSQYIRSTYGIYSYEPSHIAYFRDQDCLKITGINSTTLDVYVKVSGRRPIQAVFYCFS